MLSSHLYLVCYYYSNSSKIKTTKVFNTLVVFYVCLKPITEGMDKKRQVETSRLVEARGVFRTLPCAIASLSLVTHVGKNSTLYCFLPQIERFAPSLFDSPLTLYRKQKRQHLTALSFLFWWRRGESNPCPKICPYRRLRAQMVLNIPSKNGGQQPNFLSSR